MSTKQSVFSRYATMFRQEFKGYSGAHLIKDLLAGMTVAAVALPLALAFGAASVGPAYATVGIAAGLITAIIAGIATGLFGGAGFQISGPTGAMTVILGGIVSGAYGLNGMFVATFMAGVLLLLCGILRVGRLIRFIPRPVVVGFTSGIALVIALGQLGNFFGVSLVGDTTVDKVIYFFTDTLSDIQIPTLLCSLAVVLIMIFYPKRFAKYVPASLVAIIIITAAVALFKIDVALIGDIPASLINSVHLDFSGLSFSMLRSLISPAVTIAALGMVESLLCGTCAAGMKDQPFDSDTELLAQGIGNIVVPFFGGVPSTAAIARTSVAIKSGCQTRLTSVFQSLFLIICMFLLSPIIGSVPYAALAGVLVMTALRMNEWDAIRTYFKGKHTDAICMFLVTMLATLLLDLTFAILIGVGLGLIFLVTKLAGGNVTVRNDGDTCEISFSGAFFFATASRLINEIDSQNNQYSHIVVNCKEMIYTDTAAAIALLEMAEETKNDGKTLTLCNMSADIQKAFARTGLSSFFKTEPVEGETNG